MPRAVRQLLPYLPLPPSSLDLERAAALEVKVVLLRLLRQVLLQLALHKPENIFLMKSATISPRSNGQASRDYSVILQEPEKFTQCRDEYGHYIFTFRSPLNQ